MNSIEIIFEHIYFLHQKMKSFNTEIYNKSISFSLYDNQLKLVVFSEEDYDSLLCFCLELDSMMYLYLGSFPQIKSIKYNDEHKDITNLANKYVTDSRFSRATMVLCDIAASTINEEIYSLFKENVLWTPFYSMQYIVSAEYKGVLPVHRLTLMTHVLEGIIDIAQEKRSEINTELKEKYNIEKGENLGKYLIQASVVTAPLLQANNIYNADILELLKCNEYTFLQTITDTRNWYSHMWKEKDKTNKLKEGTPMAIYFELLYCTVRLYLIKTVLGLEVEGRFIKEHLYVLHDWIVEVYSLEKEFKSNTYILNESLKEFQKKMREITEQMVEPE